MNNFAGVWTNAVKLDGSEMLNYRGLRKAQGITVGINGRRFYSDWEGSTMFPRDIEHGADMSLVYGCRHGKQNFGGEYTHLPLPTTTWFVFDSAGLDQGAYLGTNSGSVATQNQTMTGNAADPVADGYGLVADTIEELAEQMGVPIEELVNTVETWNNSCANGNDEHYHRHESTKLLPPLRKPFGRWTLRVGAQCIANLPRREVAPSATAHVNARCLGLRAGFVQNGSRYPQTDREVVLPC